jgi:glucan phosphoethanolaminetransferase (alkaline phosphatase superfamily)
MINLKMNPTPTSIGIMFLIAILIVIGMPIALIWAINTLFPILMIPYTIETWLAAFIIPAALKAKITTKGD